jgi:DNA polymerase-3 subunit alpha
MAALDRVLEDAAAAQRERERGQTSMFGEEGSSAPDVPVLTTLLPDVPEWDLGQILKYERELTGFYITAHPLARYTAALEKFSSATTANLGDFSDGKEVKLCGIVSTVKQMTTKKGDRMAYFTIEDLQGLVEIIAFPDLFRQSGHLLAPETVIRVTGTIDRAEKGTRLKGTRIDSLVDLQARAVSKVNIRVPGSDGAGDRLAQLRLVLERHKGPTGIYLTLKLPSGVEADTGLLKEWTVLPSETFVSEVEEILGKGTVALQ